MGLSRNRAAGRRVWYWLGCSVLTVGVLGGIGAAVAREDAPPVSVIQLGPDGSSGASSGDGVPCLVEPSLDISVGTPVDGVLEEITVDRGDMVQPGKLLARLNTGVESAAVAYQSAKADFNARKKRRLEELKTSNLISTQELDEVATDQHMAEMELRERREHLKLRSIVSPIRGVVVDRFRNPGDLVKQEKILRLARLDPLHVETVLPSSAFGKVRLTQSYGVWIALANRTVKGTVSAVDKVIDAASGTFRVRLTVPNEKYDLPVGVRCRVDFEGVL
jgi:membrane fusion protein (multidrug efflux system)